MEARVNLKELIDLDLKNIFSSEFDRELGE
jgi:hypothetical protein